MRSSFRMLLLNVVLSLASFGQPVTYVSPGITLSLNTNGYLVISPKISLGILRHDGFYNITYGKAWSWDTTAYPHSFVELQYGRQSSKVQYQKQPLFVGGGVGITIPSLKSGGKSSFRFTAFTGFLYFLNATLLIADPVQADFGGQIVLPIPLSGFEIGNLNG